MTIFSKKTKLQKQDATQNATVQPLPIQSPAPGPYLNPLPPQSVQYLAPKPLYQSHPEWSRSQPTFRLKTGPVLGTQSFHQLKPKQSERPARRNNAGWIPNPPNAVTRPAGRINAGQIPNIPNGVTSPAQYVSDEADQWRQQTAGHLYQEPALVDLISSKFNSVITLIDGENFSGEEQDLVIHEGPSVGIRGGGISGTRALSRGANTAVSTAVKSTNYFAKANLYTNSKLPPGTPSIRFYIPTYPLLCLAASYSQRVYTKPTSAERETHVNADWRMGTKAMVIKSVPVDNMNTIVFAIRGSQTFMDWAVNLNSAPTSPEGFLDDPGNLCHSGFLSVARKMVKPVAARLRHMLEENPNRTHCSLLITGHSAGGAVASLLYAHMTAREVNSELGYLTGCFRRIHCITFGAPPISLLPLQKPKAPQFKKSHFLSFINEGDPVPRADKAYVRSLIDLYAAPAPGQTSILPLLIPAPKPGKFFTKPKALKTKPNKLAAPAAVATSSMVWKVPPISLSNAGKLVVLRSRRPEDEQEIVAYQATDEQLRGVVFGDPVKHMMKLYASRIDALATNAILAKGRT